MYLVCKCCIVSCWVGVARWRWVAPIFKRSPMEASLENTLVFSAPPGATAPPQRLIISAIYKMNLVSFGPSNRADKKYQIIFSNPNKTIHFGSKNSETYLDHEDKIKRSNYIARHSVRENWQEVNAGSLSRFLLWGETTDLKTNLNAYLKRFNIKK